MAEKINIELKNYGAVVKAIKEVPTRLKGQALRKVNREGAKITRNRMKSLAPHGGKTRKVQVSSKSRKTGKITQRNRIVNLRNSIKIQADKTNRSGVIVGPTNYVARFFEMGTKDRYTKKGAYRGKMQKRPFVEPAIDQTYKEVIRFIDNNIGKIISEFLRKKLSKLRK